MSHGLLSLHTCHASCVTMSSRSGPLSSLLSLTCGGVALVGHLYHDLHPYHKLSTRDRVLSVSPPLSSVTHFLHRLLPAPVLQNTPRCTEVGASIQAVLSHLLLESEV